MVGNQMRVEPGDAWEPTSRGDAEGGSGWMMMAIRVQGGVEDIRAGRHALQLAHVHIEAQHAAYARHGAREASGAGKSERRGLELLVREARPPAAGGAAAADMRRRLADHLEANATGARQLTIAQDLGNSARRTRSIHLWREHQRARGLMWHACVIPVIEAGIDARYSSQHGR